MKYSIIILITQLLLWGCCRSERSILESFYKALDGDEWGHKENWLSDKPLNEWYGITTDEEGKVVKIQLSDTMRGKVPANLKYASIYFNVPKLICKSHHVCCIIYKRI